MACLRSRALSPNRYRKNNGGSEALRAIQNSAQVNAKRVRNLFVICEMRASNNFKLT